MDHSLATLLYKHNDSHSRLPNFPKGDGIQHYRDFQLMILLSLVPNRYEDIKSKADKIVYTSKEYTPYCMLKRNRHLVDYSTKCICYLTENKGGTAYTIDYARKQNVSVINIALD